MSGQPGIPCWLSAVLCPAFGLFLFLAQFTANGIMPGLGVLLILAGVWLWLWFGVLLAFTPLQHLECRGEERQLLKIQGQEYVAYQQRAGIFLPQVGM